jgi:hypothetical protein
MIDQLAAAEKINPSYVPRLLRLLRLTLLALLKSVSVGWTKQDMQIST